MPHNLKPVLADSSPFESKPVIVWMRPFDERVLRTIIRVRRALGRQR